MANDRYLVVCDVAQGVTPSEGACTHSYEARVYESLLPPLSLAEAGLIASAVIGVWAVAFLFKRLAVYLQS